CSIYILIPVLCYLHSYTVQSAFFSFFFFNDTSTTEIYTLSLHDALPIWKYPQRARARCQQSCRCRTGTRAADAGQRALALHHIGDRKSTRLNSSHLGISYAVFCLKKKKKTEIK